MRMQSWTQCDSTRRVGSKIQWKSSTDVRSGLGTSRPATKSWACSFHHIFRREISAGISADCPDERLTECPRSPNRGKYVASARCALCSSGHSVLPPLGDGYERFSIRREG